MNKHPVALAIALALSVSVVLPGCDSTANLTEQEHIQRAKDFQDKGKIKASIVELKNAIQKNPDSPQARLLLGQIYLKAGMGAEAEKELKRAETLGVSGEVITPIIGEALLLMGEYQRVLDEIQTGDKTSPTNRARILQLRGHALLKLGKLKEGCDLFQQSRAVDANIPQTYWGLAQCAVAEHDMKQARAWLDEAIKLPSEQAHTHMFIGDWEQLNHNPQAALAAYSAALKAEPDNLEALQNRVTLNLKAGQVEAARVDIEHVEKLVPKTAPAYYLRALLLFQQKNFAATNDALQGVFKTMPQHLPSILLAGATAFELGSYEQAESYLKRYLTRYPEQAYATRILAATQIKLNKADKALETLAPLLSPDSQDAAAMNLAGEARSAMQDPARAAEWFARAAAIDPKNAALRTRMGINHLSAGDFPHALPELQAAAAIAPKQYEADNLLVLAYLEQKQFDKALASIQEMERKLPGNPAVSVLRGQAYTGMHDLARARNSFDAALAIDPDFYPAIASLAQLDLLENKPDAARKRFEGVLNKHKNHLQAMLALAQLETLQKNTPAAQSWLEKAAAAYPQALEPRQRLVSLFIANQAYPQALAVANEALQAHPDSLVALDLMGSAQLAAGQKENALVSATRLAEKMPKAAAAQLKLAQAQLNLGKLDAARTSLNRALVIQPDFLPAQEMLFNLEIQTGHSGEALRIAHQFQVAQPKLADGFLLEGKAQLAAKQPAAAAQAFARALAIDRKNTTLIQWHQAAYLAGNSAQADEQIAQWLKAHPTDFSVRAYMAQHYMNTGRTREAIAQYEIILQQTPNNVLALNNLASLYQQQKDPRALATAEKAFKLNPKDAAIQDTLGWILLEQGQGKRGLQLIQSAVSVQPNIPTLRYHYAVALAQTGSKVQARAELEQLLVKSPVFPEAAAAKTLLNSL
jgi:putative PEP-CTERM system TPR-repeat lipoprotein